MRAMVGLVIGMGVLIVVGVAVVVVTIIHRMVPALPAPAHGPVVASVLDEPAGTRIEAASLAGDRLVVTLQGGGTDRVVILDLASGRLLGEVRLSR